RGAYGTAGRWSIGPTVPSGLAGSCAGLCADLRFGLWAPQQNPYADIPTRFERELTRDGSAAPSAGPPPDPRVGLRPASAPARSRPSAGPLRNPRHPADGARHGRWDRVG